MNALFLRNQRGYVLITTGAVLLAFLSLFALVVDFGNIFVAKSQLQNTADSAALAAVVEIPKGISSARLKAQQFGNSHYVAGSHITVSPSDVLFGRYNFQTGEYEEDEEPANMVWVTARKTEGSASGPLELFFAPFFGKETSNVRATSKAVLDNHVNGVHGKNRLIPYTVLDSVVDVNGDGQFDIGSVIDIHPRKNAPGNFGYLDLDGGSNGTPELRYYIENGYDKDFVIPPGGFVPVSGTTGIRGQSTLVSFQVIIGDVVFLPVHNAVHEQGSNAVYDVIDILAVKIQSVNLTGNQDNRYIRTEIVYTTSSVLVTNPDAPENNSLAKPKLVA